MSMRGDDVERLPYAGDARGVGEKTEPPMLQPDSPAAHDDAPAADTVGVIGLGAMGSRIVPHLRRAGFPLVVHDVLPERIRALAADGIRGVGSPAEVAHEARRIITFLPTLEAIEQVVLGENGLRDVMGPGTVLIEMSSSTPALSRRLAAELAQRGVAMLDSPVSGTTPAAESATLVAMVGGGEDALEDCRPILEALTSRIFHCGEVGQGNAMKLALNLLVYVPVIAAFESAALAAKLGLSPRMLLDVINAGAAKSYIVDYKLAKALARDYVPGGSVDVAVKDIELAIQLAQEAGVPLLLPPVALQSFLYAKGAGLGNQDTAIILSLYEKLLGIKIEG